MLDVFFLYNANLARFSQKTDFLGVETLISGKAPGGEGGIFGMLFQT